MYYSVAELRDDKKKLPESIREASEVGTVILNAHL
ncbi:Uncharacterised protein [Serratia rubidaea]|uniref:Uncharacterized protein n=1 Tax=Serratia rubidaea TaxID=61652 RepID=A0A447QQZ5_SERRU|nr:hypothetical protein D781_1267 [Serratia sp. FGI94]CAI0932058.1 Uncharacterised protein [Serratia rubidaea]CAI1754169.1 Uncharacterised protein [Serratia rubidaea]VEA72455.1 Uncharacterised protein [Serratia rubidaea]VTP61038.1 Uncharacterised protein [Serratia rubidaea]